MTAAVVCAALADADAAQRRRGRSGRRRPGSGSTVSASAGCVVGAQAQVARRAGSGSTTLPGFIRSSGSKIALSSPKALDRSGRRT